jgi:hypothetical protein
MSDETGEEIKLYYKNCRDEEDKGEVNSLR